MLNRERIGLRHLSQTQVPFLVLVAHVVHLATRCMTLGIMGTMGTRDLGDVCSLVQHELRGFGDSQIMH